MLRPKTWYLVLAAIFIILCVITGPGTIILLLLLIAAALTSLAIIPLNKNRKLQSALCLLPMALLLAWYILAAVYNVIPEFNYGNYCFPALAILLIFMARKGIVHDERVVRALDRIR